MEQSPWTIDRREFLGCLAVGAAGLAMGPLPSPKPSPALPARRPNILVFLADDLGYGELGCQGCADIPTPNIDALARGGARFTDGYVSAPLGSPMRAGMMTGRYPQRFGYEHNPGPTPPATFGLPASEPTLAECLKAAGYVTGLVGKWHLGGAQGRRPAARGFDEFFGFLGGSAAPAPDGSNSESRLGAIGGASGLLRGNAPVIERGDLTAAFAREAAAFVRRHRVSPFFLCLSFSAVRVPLAAAPEYLERFARVRGPKRRRFAAMLAAMDDGVGAVLAELTRCGLRNDTLVFFLSDNGGPTRQTTSSNRPLAGHKSQLYEGGIRVPFMAAWPGRIRPALVTEPVISLDILPTALAAAGAAAADGRLDGVSLLPLLTGQSTRPPHEALYWRIGEQWAARRGEWKMVRMPGQPARLYNLAGDIGETLDVAEARPDVLKSMLADHAAWVAGLAEPMWAP